MSEWLDQDELLDQAHDLMEMGLHDEALRLLERYASFYPHDAEIELLYAHLYTELNEPEKAIAHLHAALALESDNIDCLLGLYYSYAQIGRIDTALPFLERAQQLAPDSEAVVGSMLWHLNNAGRFSEAIAFFEKKQPARFENPETFRNAGCAYQHLRRHAAAESCFKFALKLNPHFHEARDLLADSYLMNGEGDRAVAAYRDYLRESPNHVHTMSRLVFALCQLERYDEALQEARAMIRTYPNSPVGHVDLAYVFLCRDELDQALASAQRGLDLAPLDAEAHRVAAIVCSEKGDDEAAGKLFVRALELDPDNVEVKRDYYHHLRAVGDTAKMLAMVDDVIKAERPFCTEDCWFLADFYRDQGHEGKALHYLHTAYRLMPDETELILPMVDIMLDRKRFAAADRFMAFYVRRSGWNEAMQQFTRRRRLRGWRAQEGLRLLRFMGQPTPAFRRYLLAHYMLRFAFIGAIAVASFCLIELSVLFGIFGALIGGGIISGVAVGWAGFLLVKHRFFNRQAA